MKKTWDKNIKVNDEDEKIKRENQEEKQEGKMFYLGEMLSIHDINNFFKHFINPSLTEAKIEKATAAQLRGQRQVPMQWIMMFAVLIIAAGIGYMIISSVMNNNVCQAELANIAKQSARVVTIPQGQQPPQAAQATQAATTIT